MDRFGGFGMLSLPLGVQKVIEHPVQPSIKNPLGLRGGLGPELVTNGDFGRNESWSKEAAWSIGSGVATYSDASNASLTQSKTWGLTQGGVYQISFDLAGLTAGNIVLRVALSKNIPFTLQYIYDPGGEGANLVNGTYSKIFTVTLNTVNNLDFRAYTDSGSSFTIDNVSLRQIL